MKKAALAALVALTLLLLGCSSIPGIPSDSAVSPKIIRKAQIAGKWELRHVSLEVAAREQLPVLLKLSDGDRVDGYFYLEKGSNIEFQITANSLVYKSAQDAVASKGITSDRFSFTASQAQGSTYTLTFRNPAAISDKQTRVTVFLEVIYPASGTLFTLLENK